MRPFDLASLPGQCSVRFILPVCCIHLQFGDVMSCPLLLGTWAAGTAVDVLLCPYVCCGARGSEPRLAGTCVCHARDKASATAPGPV